MTDSPKQPRQKRGSSASRLVALLRELPDTAFQFAQDITDKLTVSRIALVFVASIFATAAMVLYENRTSLIEIAANYLEGGNRAEADWQVSQETKIDLVKFVKNQELVNFALVTQIDLKKNRRSPRFWYLESDKAEAVSKKAAILVPQPVFDDDGKNTSQILAVLNTDFLCTPYGDTIFARHFPELKEEMPVICRMSIPPIFGQFTGILTIGMKRVPTKDEVAAIRQLAAEMSTKIYMKDIVQRPLLIQAP